MEPEELLHRAIDLSDNEEYEQALNLLTRVIVIDSDNAQAYFERGMAFLNLDQNAEAVSDFDRVLTIDPMFPGALEWRSTALASLGEHKNAADDLLRYLQLQPDGPPGMGVSPQKWADCGEALINAGCQQKAHEVLKDYFDNYANKVTSYSYHETAPMRLLAEIKLKLGDFHQACDVAKQAYSSEYKCPADILVYALALESSGNFVEARRICKEAMEANDQMPGLKELHERLAE